MSMNMKNPYTNSIMATEFIYCNQQLANQNHTQLGNSKLLNLDIKPAPSVTQNYYAWKDKEVANLQHWTDNRNHAWKLNATLNITINNSKHKDADKLVQSSLILAHCN